MITSQPLRLYANPVKQFLLLLGAAAFVWIGVVLLQDPKVRANPSKTAMAYIAIVFFGLCAAVFLIMMLRYVVVRHPVLQIDAQGWTYNPPLAGEAQVVPWQDIGAIALCRQKLPRNTMYYLVVYADNPWNSPTPRAQAFATRFYPSLSGAAMSIPLNAFFTRATPTKCKRLLERIVSSSGHEIKMYDVQVSGEMYDM
jgi:hypothetical protein